jgi:hypothetical protein
MARDRYEPNRFLGFPLTKDPHARQVEEPQRVMGIPVDLFSDVDLGGFRALAHPIREYRRWRRGVRQDRDPYATDDEPGRGR